jgi:hypothetical protein
MKIDQEHGQQLDCHLTFTFERSGQSTEVLVSVKSADLENLEKNGFDAKYVISRINDVLGGARARKVVLKASRNGPLVSVAYFIDDSENYHEIKNLA